MSGYDFTWDRRLHLQRYCRAIGLEQSLFFIEEPWTPPPINPEAAPVSYYSPERIAAVRQRLAGVDRRAYLRGILERLGCNAMSERERVAAVCAFVHQALYYNPTQVPREEGTGRLVMDPVELLELHDARCDQGAAVTQALLAEAGVEARCAAAPNHTVCEAYYDGGWHLADALVFGADQPHRNGEVLSLAALLAEPYLADAFPVRCFVYHPEELVSSDGYRLLGYVFGEWGSLPYYSGFLGAPMDYPPTLPLPLATQRLAGGGVRLRWAPSLKRGGGRVEYRLRLFADRERTQQLLTATVVQPFFDWDGAELNRHYTYDVCAMDDHREKNPDTWYPTLPGNFVLVPPDQYGWYGVL